MIMESETWQPSESVMLKKYVPAQRFEMEEVVSPVDHKKVNGPIPVGMTDAEPSQELYAVLSDEVSENARLLSITSINGELK